MKTQQLDVTLYTTAGGGKSSRWPKWKRTVGVSDDGDIFVPAAFYGHEAALFLCTSSDGEPVCYCMKHLFIRTDWLKREMPKRREELEGFEAKVKQVIGSLT